MALAMREPMKNWNRVPVMGKAYALSTCLFQMLKKMLAAYQRPKSRPRYRILGLLEEELDSATAAWHRGDRAAARLLCLRLTARERPVCVDWAARSAASRPSWLDG
jgi:hypothetical protein